MYLDNSLVQESAVELIRVVGLVMSILMLSLSNSLRAVWQADSINGRNSIFKFNLITSYRDDYSKSRRQRMNTEIIELKRRMVLELLEEELKTKSLIKKAILIKLYLMLSR